MNTINPYKQNNQTFTSGKLKFKNISDNLNFNQIYKDTNFNTGEFDNVKNNIKKLIKKYIQPIQYTSKHRTYFLKIEKELTGKNTINGYLHDLDKLFLYVIGIPEQIAHKIHKAISAHHVRNGKVRNPIQAVIDWESARYTKPDKPLNAREYYENYYVKKQNLRIPEIENALQKLGL